MKAEIEAPRPTELPHLSESQLAAANAIFYLHVLDTVDEKARNYASLLRLEGSPEDYSTLYERSRTGLEDTYYHMKAGDALATRNYGEETSNYKAILSPLLPELDSFKADLMQKATSFTDKTMFHLIYQINKRQKEMTEAQRAYLFRSIGYTEEESKQIAKSIAISAPISVITGAAFGGLTSAAATAGKFHPYLSEHLTVQTAIVAGASYALHYGTLIFNGKTNEDLLKDDSVKTSPNVFATSLYYLAKKFLPDHPRLQKLGVMAGTLGPAAFSESLFMSALLYTANGPSFTVARNITGAALNIAQGNVNKIWLRTAQEKKKTEVK